MNNQFTRTEMLIGATALEALAKKRVAIFGIGGVGGYTVEALARSGVGTLDLIDNDTVNLTIAKLSHYIQHWINSRLMQRAIEF